MDMSVWLPSVAALIVGFTSSFVGYKIAQKQIVHGEIANRVENFRRYERVIRDCAIDWEINVMGYPGSHFKRKPEDLENARNAFYAHIHELENHKHYYKLLSPFPDVPEYDPGFAVEYYSAIENTLRDHLKKYPTPLDETPYPVDTNGCQ